MNKKEVIDKLRKELANNTDYEVIYDDWNGEWVICVKEYEIDE